MNISFDSSELIKELKRDITECGTKKLLAVWLRRYPQAGNVELAVNYDFIVPESPIGADEVGENERIVTMEAGILLEMLEKQKNLI